MKKILTFLLSCTVFAAGAQVRSVHGTVTSQGDGTSIAGVMVTIVGSSTVAVTDGAGAYTVEAKSGDELTFSLLGFVTATATVGTSSTIDITLAPDDVVMEDVVVIGYGVQQKKLVTGATVQVTGEDIAKQNTVNALSAMQSRTPGVNIMQGSGMPGTEYGFHVSIRGKGTNSNPTPLFVIDGTPAGNDTEVMANLNPSDIESIDILKDAASAAIYGARAANGVILITTKRGRKSSKMNVSLDAYYGFQNSLKLPQMLNAQEYAVLMNEARLMDGLQPYDFASMVPNWDKIESGEWKGTNWIKESRVKNAPLQNYTLGMTGGTEQSVYSMGFGYTSQEGIFGKPVQAKHERYSARINSEYTTVKGRSFDIVKFGENLTYSFMRQQGRMGMGDQWGNYLNTLMRTNPFLPMYDADGNYHNAIDWDPGQANPIARQVLSTASRHNSLSKNHSLRANLYLTVQPIKNLIFKSSFGYSYYTGSNRAYSPSYKLGSETIKTTEEMTQGSRNSQSISWENTLTYSFTAWKVHKFTALLGQSIEKWGGSMGDNMSATNRDPRFHSLEYAYLDNTGNVGSYTTVQGAPVPMGRLASFFGRVGWDYRNKYMATVVLRADGSHNFARGKRWGYFPSVSAGWVVTEEPFMERVRPVMNFLKIRASWGQNGNQDVKSFQYLAAISNGGRYLFGGEKQNPSIAFYPNNLPNEDISWETSEQIDLGLDAGFFGDRLSLNFDWYIKNTKNWLVDAPQLTSYGSGGTTYINGGDIRNTGVEIALGWKDRVGDFTYGINANVAFNKNKVLRIANTEGIIHGPTNMMFQPHDEAFRVQVGYPIGYFYGYSTAGVFQNQEQIDNYKGAKLPDTRPGDLIWVDRDGNGVIDKNDRGMIGDPNPDAIVGLGIDLGWKGIDLNITMQGKLGGQIMRTWRSWPQSPRDNYTMAEAQARWSGEGTSNRFPRLSFGSHPNRQWISDIYVEDGSFLRIQSITLGYNFATLFKKGFLSQARLYVMGQNLHIFTKYSGLDPEIGWGPNSWSSGIDVGYYPAPRTIILGVNFKF